MNFSQRSWSAKLSLKKPGKLVIRHLKLLNFRKPINWKNLSFILFSPREEAKQSYLTSQPKTTNHLRPVNLRNRSAGAAALVGDKPNWNLKSGLRQPSAARSTQPGGRGHVSFYPDEVGRLGRGHHTVPPRSITSPADLRLVAATRGAARSSLRSKSEETALYSNKKYILQVF